MDGSAQGPSADELLEMSSEEVLERLRRGATSRLETRMARSSSSPALSVGRGRGELDELKRLSLKKSGDRTRTGGLFSRNFEWDKITHDLQEGRPIPAQMQELTSSRGALDEEARQRR